MGGAACVRWPADRFNYTGVRAPPGMTGHPARPEGMAQGPALCGTRSGSRRHVARQLSRGSQDPAGGPSGSDGRQKRIVAVEKLVRAFEVGKSAGGEGLNVPVSLRPRPACFTEIPKIASGSVRQPDGEFELLIDVADVLAEQASGKKRVGGVLRAGLMGRKVVVGGKTLIDVIRPPGPLQEISNAGGANEGAIDRPT